MNKILLSIRRRFFMVCKYIQPSFGFKKSTREVDALRIEIAMAEDEIKNMAQKAYVAGYKYRAIAGNSQYDELSEKVALIKFNEWWNLINS